MAKKFRTIWYVDLPNPLGGGDDDDNSFVNVQTFRKRKEAFAFLRERWGMPTRVASFFISKGTESGLSLVRPNPNQGWPMSNVEVRDGQETL